MRDSDPMLEQLPAAPSSRNRSARPRDASLRGVEARTRPAAALDARRWSIKLELAQEQIAQIYQQGLARGAEVWRHGGWRPLLTTHELRGALHAPRRAAAPQRKSAPRWAPPPPPVGAPSVGVHLAELTRNFREPKIVERALPPMRAKFESISDFEDTLVRATPAPFTTVAVASMALTSPAALTAVEQRAARRTPAATVRPAARRRYWELVLVAALTMLLTSVALRALDEHRAPEHANALVAAQVPTPPVATQQAVAPASSPAPAQSLIPVVNLRDLPLQGAAGSAVERAPTSAAGVSNASLRAPLTVPVAAASMVTSAHTPPSAPDRATLARALSRAARSAQSCGEGPETARVVVSYAPSGIPRGVHFGSVAPSRAIRGCVLGAISRAVIPPFSGEGVTVEKTIAW